MLPALDALHSVNERKMPHPTKHTRINEYIDVLKNLKPEVLDVTAKNFALTLLHDKQLWNGSDEDGERFRVHVEAFTYEQLKAMVAHINPTELPQYDMKAHVKLLVDDMKGLPDDHLGMCPSNTILRPPSASSPAYNASRPAPFKTAHSSSKHPKATYLRPDMTPYKSKQVSLDALFRLSNQTDDDKAVFDKHEGDEDFDWVNRLTFDEYNVTTHHIELDDGTVFAIYKDENDGVYSYVRRKDNEWSIVSDRKCTVYNDVDDYMLALGALGTSVVKVTRRNTAKDKHRRMALEGLFFFLRVHVAIDEDESVLCDDAQKTALKIKNDDYSHLESDLRGINRLMVQAMDQDRVQSSVKYDLYYSTTAEQGPPKGTDMNNLVLAIVYEKDNDQYHWIDRPSDKWRLMLGDVLIQELNDADAVERVCRANYRPVLMLYVRPASTSNVDGDDQQDSGNVQGDESDEGLY